MRQAFAGMLWSKQLYYYDVARWLDGDPAQPPPPPQRLTGRNSRWRNFDAFDIMSMPDKWEYPWFAAWDLAFHCVALAHVDPAFAKYQLILLCREWFQHPNGALPAYEWDFGDVNPPVQAWAALEVFAIDGGRDLDFLSRVFDKLLVNFTWWVNREDADGNNLFEGGFLGLDNIGPIDRSHLPVGGILEQSDATGWMGFYAIAMAASPPCLNRSGQRPAHDLVLKFLEHFAAISDALEDHGLWDEADGLYYDRLITPSGQRRAGAGPVDGGHHPAAGRRASSTRVISSARWRWASSSRTSWTAMASADPDKLARARRAARGAGPPAAAAQPGRRGPAGAGCSPGCSTRRVPVPVRPARPVGLATATTRTRSTSKASGPAIDYEPAESTTAMFGGNSNWRGPVWFPLNYLVISALERYHRFFGDDFTIEYPTGSGQQLTLDEIAADLRGPAHLDLHPRPGRPAALLRRDRAAAARPGLAGQPGLQRVLPRRQRRRARRRAPDRLDRPDRRRDPPPPRRRARPSAT